MLSSYLVSVAHAFWVYPRRDRGCCWWNVVHCFSRSCRVGRTIKATTFFVVMVTFSKTPVTKNVGDCYHPLHFSWLLLRSF